MQLDVMNLSDLRNSYSMAAGIFAFILFFLFCSLLIRKRNRSQNNKRQKLPPPQPGGAWPLIGHLPFLAGPKPPQVTLGDMADKCGPIFIVKMGVHRSLVVSTWELAKECFTTHDKVFANRPNFLTAEIMGYNNAMIGFSQYGPYWRQLRKITTLGLLSNHRLQMLRHIRESEIKAAAQDLYKLWAKKSKLSATTSGKTVTVVKMQEWFGNVALNVISRIIVGRRYVNCTTPDEGAEMEEWREAMKRFFVLAAKFVVSDALPFLRWLDFGGYEKAMKKTAEELDVVVQGWLDEHKRKRMSGKIESEDQDFMDVMLSVLDEEGELSSSYDADTINKATCLAFTLAASDTTKLSLTGALASLLNNPEILKKVQQELDTQIGRERNVNESDINNLVYLQAVIKETLRLHPPAPLSLPHESMEDCSIGGYFIPKGTRLLLNVWKMHRDSRVWSDPCDFRPERFLTTHQDVDVRGQNFELLPFGSGRRMCPGAPFALHVMQLTLATLLHGFDISIPSDKSIQLDDSFGFNNIDAFQVEASLSPRLALHLYG